MGYEQVWEQEGLWISVGRAEDVRNCCEFRLLRGKGEGSLRHEKEGRAWDMMGWG